MAQWNLSVDLRAQGNSLGRALRDDARAARALATAVRSTTTDVRALGTASSATANHIQGMGRQSDAARARLRRLASQAAGASRDLRRLADEAERAERRLSSLDRSTRIRVGLDDRTGPGLASLRATLTDLRRMGPINLTADLDARNVAAAAAAFRAVRDEVQTTSRTLTVMATRARALANSLDELRTAALAAAGGLLTLRSAAAHADGQLRSLSTSTRALRSDLDDLDGSLTRITGRLTTVTTGTRTLGGGAAGTSRNIRGLIAGALLLGTALIPIAAATVPLAAGMVAAGAGVGVFGAAIAGQIKSLTEASEAETKYQEAVEEHGAHSKEAAEAQLAYSKQMAKMPPATRETAAAFAVLKDQYTDYSDALADDTMPVATKSMAVMGDMLQRTTPLAKGASREMDRFVTILAGGMQTEGFDEFADKFSEFSTTSLAKANSGLVSFTRGLDTGEIGGNVREFMDYAEQHGPLVGDTLSNLVKALTNLLVASSDVGVGVLTIVNAFAGLVSAVPPEFIATLLQVVIAIKAVQLAAAGIGAARVGMAAFGTTITTMGVAASGATGAVHGLRVAFSALGTTAKLAIAGTAIGLLVVAITALSQRGKDAPDIDRLTTSLGKLGDTGKVTGEAARAFGKDFSGLANSIKQLNNPSNHDKFQSFMSGLVGMDSAHVKNWKEEIDAADQALANLVKGGKPELAKAALAEITKALQAQGVPAEEIAGRIDAYNAAMADAAFEQEHAAKAMGLFGAQAQATSAKLAAQKASADGLRQSIQALNDVNRAALGGMIGLEQSIDDAAATAAKNADALHMVGGKLNLNSQGARDNAKALQDLATKTDEAAAAAKASNAPWQEVNEIYARGRGEFIKTAQAMGLLPEEAKQLADSYNLIPEEKSTLIKMRSEDAVAGLDAVIAKMEATPKAKSITVDALTNDAMAILTSLGYTVTTLPNGKVTITAATGTAITGIAGVKAARDGLTDKSLAISAPTSNAIADLLRLRDQVAATKGKTVTMNVPTAEGRRQLELLGYKIQSTKGKTVVISVPTGSAASRIAALQRQIDSLSGKTINITTHYQTTGSPYAPSGGRAARDVNANGSITDFYANGGVRSGSSFAHGGTSPDTPNGHLAHIAPAGTWRVFAEDETGGESYIPLATAKRPRSRAIAEETVRRLGGDPEAIQWNADGNVTDWRYDPTSGSLYSPSDAGSAGKKTKKVKGKDVAYFDLGAVEARLKRTSDMTRRWNADLAKVADRVGGDVADALASMGTDGYELTKKMATGSTTYINQMAAALRGLASTAKASLTDYTRQMSKATAMDAKFATNLATLAGRGYGDLAKQLAAQGDQAAMDLATAAIGDNGKASAANTAAKQANQALTGDQVQQLVAIIAAVTTSKTGIHQVAESTGIGEDAIVAVATKARSQISGALGTRGTKFLADLARAEKGLSFANGGIRPGIYSTHAGAVTFAEPSTGGEAFLPLGAHKRGPATRVLADVAGRFGLGLTPADSGRPVVIIRQEGDTHISVPTVRTGAGATDIASQVSRSYRRARRGGVAARAGR
ncbi:hypothetical protein ACFQ6Q_00400 [Streptomyces sp. NPDC056437]|uniref:hypothetical protein n=1 Tax=Streptomyces sp. NPDC056437 TaxID=3345816 RepID=UPI00367F4A25